MKIEVEYHEIKILEDKIQQLQTENKKLSIDINENNYPEKAVELAQKLFNYYMEQTMAKLGFTLPTHWMDRVVHFTPESRNWVSVNRSYKENNELFNIELKAILTQNTAQAFIQIGVDKDHFKQFLV